MLRLASFLRAGLAARRVVLSALLYAFATAPTFAADSADRQIQGALDDIVCLEQQLPASGASVPRRQNELSDFLV